MSRGLLGKYQKITPEQMEKQINSLSCKLDMAALNFATSVATRARDVFKRSFKYHRFYSADGKPWQALSENTIAKRKKKGTLNLGILRDYETLVGSIEFSTVGNYRKTINHISRERIFTNPAKFAVPTNPHRGFCYAGVHNNPGPNETYGNGFGRTKRVVKVVQRQFMGFSTYIDSYVEENMNKLLFDKVFGTGVMIETPIQQ